MPDKKHPARGADAAFTLTELMVVIAVIVILIGILIPVVSNIRKSAQEASTKAFIAEMSGAMDTYHTDHHSYPGPLPNDQIYTDLLNQPGPNLGWVQNGNPQPFPNSAHITGAENAVLGLVGGFTLPTGSLVGSGVQAVYDDSLLGKGALSMNVAQPKRYSGYMGTTGLSSGHYTDESGDAGDTIIPEFLDRFNNPMPILVLRANVGRTIDLSKPLTAQNNAIITDGTLLPRQGNYDISQVIGYTGAFTNANSKPDTALPPAPTARSIGMGKDLGEVCTDGSGTTTSWKNKAGFHGLRTVHTDSNTSLNDAQTPGNPRSKYYFPYDAYAYFTNTQMAVPTAANPGVVPTPRQKDRYILISAGKDRVYGTDDDITNFGSGSGQ